MSEEWSVEGKKRYEHTYQFRVMKMSVSSLRMGQIQSSTIDGLDSKSG